MVDTAWNVWQREEVVAGFVARRRAGILGGDVQLETLLRLVAATGAKNPQVLDLGCGDGVLLEAIYNAWPTAVGVALDGSAAMLERARVRLGAHSTTFVEADFSETGWQDRLPLCAFDAIISGFAIHHCEDDQKEHLYRELFALLRPGGVLVNVEHVASVSPRTERFWEDAWCENVARQTGAALEAVHAAFLARADRHANRLAPVERQLAWLRTIGFTEVDCYWKHFELAVFAGFKEDI